jgi:hypothetical protein
MKTLLHTIGFLFEDILRRWFENPLSVLAKITITAVLVTIASIILISFYVSENSIESRIAELGGNTVILREYRSNFDTRQAGYYMADFFESRMDVDLVSVINVPDMARTEYGTTAQIITSRGDIAGPPQNLNATLYTNQYPADIETVIYAFDNPVSAVTREIPNWIERFATGDVAILPYALCSERVERSFELISILQVKGGPEEAVELAQSVDNLSRIEDRQGVRVISPEGLLRELKRLRQSQGLWQVAIVLGMGSAMAIILSVISLLEYKQWGFYSALLRSLGMNSVFIYFRYVVDALIPTLIAGAATLYAVASFAGLILPSIGVDASGLQQLDLGQFLFEDGIFLVAFLIIGASSGSLPVAILLRKPIGKVMA